MLEHNLSTYKLNFGAGNEWNGTHTHTHTEWMSLTFNADEKITGRITSKNLFSKEIALIIEKCDEWHGEAKQCTGEWEREIEIESDYNR